MASDARALRRIAGSVPRSTNRVAIHAFRACNGVGLVTECDRLFRWSFRLERLSGSSDLRQKARNECARACRGFPSSGHPRGSENATKSPVLYGPGDELFSGLRLSLTGTTTYCLPSTMYVLGVAKTPPPRYVSQRILPV